MVNFTNHSYSQHYEQVNKVKSVYDGVDSAALYLQKFVKESADNYNDRQDTATLDNYVFRAVDSIKNIIFRQDLDTSDLESTPIAPYLDEIDFQNSLNEFTKNLTVAVQRDGFAYILVDAPVYNDDIQTRADEINNNLRPYFNLIERNRVINWRVDAQNNYTMVVIQETIYEPIDEFQEEQVIQHRVFYNDGRIQIWREGKLFQELETKLKDIPLIKVGKDDIPPLYDLAKININHMNRASELNNYIRIGSAPIPVMYGANSQDGAIQTIGINDGLVFNSPKSEAGFEWVEMSGQNAAVIREQLKDDEEAMLNTVVTLITDGRTKTATEVTKENTENEAKILDLALRIEEGINKAIWYFGEYLGTQINGEVQINRDYDSNKLTPQQIAEYRNDYTQGIISWEKLIEVLTQGEVYPKMDEKELEQEKNRIVIGD